jgi:hypothetical protein
VLPVVAAPETEYAPFAAIGPSTISARRMTCGLSSSAIAVPTSSSVALGSMYVAPPSGLLTSICIS